MTRRLEARGARLLRAAVFGGMLALPGAAGAQPEAPTPTPPAGCVRGRDLVSADELAAHRARMLAATSPEERETVRRELHEQVRRIATERKLTLCKDAMKGMLGTMPAPGGMGPGPRGGVGGGPPAPGGAPSPPAPPQPSPAD